MTLFDCIFVSWRFFCCHAFHFYVQVILADVNVSFYVQNVFAAVDDSLTISIAVDSAIAMSNGSDMSNVSSASHRDEDC